MSINQSAEQVGSDLKDSGEILANDLSQLKDEAIQTKNNVMQKVRVRTEELTSDLAEQLGGQLEALQDRFDELSTSMKERLRTMDQNLHERPYWYLAGAAAVGLGLGLYARRNANIKLDS